MNRTNILNTANTMVNGDREADYGTPENNFETIASLWADYLYSRNYGLNLIVDAKDVAAMLVLLKVARVASGHAKTDNWVDIAGYAACGGEIEGNYERLNAEINGVTCEPVPDTMPEINLDLEALDASFKDVGADA